MKQFLLLALISALVVFSTSAATAEETWKLTTYDSLTIDPTSGLLIIEGKPSGLPTPQVKLEVNLPEIHAGQLQYCTIRVLEKVYAQGETLPPGTDLHHFTWVEQINLRNYIPPYPQHILDRIRDTGFRPEPPRPINILKNYKGVAIESKQWVDGGRKLKRSVLKIDFSQFPDPSEAE